MDYIDKIKEIDNYIKNNLTNKRYIHSVNVANMASDIALKFGLNTNAAYLAGLSHDIAREFTKDELFKGMNKCFGFSDDFCSNISLFHGPVGALFIQNRFNIIDKDILDAVSFHTVGGANISALAKVVYIADYISADREHVTTDYRNNIKSCNSLNLMLYKVSSNYRDFLLNTDNKVMPESEEMYNMLLRILNEE
ncbi:MAG: hypothetical protein B6229_06020 [Spirochaetaceae bacterium 4572_7]|nr:MAG: hypothetical protein B6229_06020 [Spirochaetaceae bacterium 4572_7]